MSPTRVLILSSIVGVLSGAALSQGIEARDAAAQQRFLADRAACTRDGFRAGTQLFADCVLRAAERRIDRAPSGAADS